MLGQWLVTVMNHSASLRIGDHVWTIEELCGLLPKPNTSTAQIDKKLVLKALGD